MKSTRFLSLILILMLYLPGMAAPGSAGASPRTGAGPVDQQVAALLETMTPKERVGQLMLVTFDGSTLNAETAINQLITAYNIGGVILRAENDNINGQINTPRLVQSLTTGLQELAFEAAQATQDAPVPRPYVPLFVATRHDGNGQPGTEIAVGTTPLPSALSLGATWNPEWARITGSIAGSELSAMGVNLLLGPALDIVQRSQASRTFDLGVDTFGGEPFWVGQMAQAYITGVHTGSQGRVAVVARNFPGLGYADTHPDDEIPVVPRTVDELQAFDLVPYAAVTGQAPDNDSRADGIQCANIRYQGDSIRAITRPVCIDEQAAGALLDLDAFAAWRDRGLVISSALGSHAIRRFYNTTPFPHRQVAREAFLAGNDLLVLDDFGPTPGSSQLQNVIDVIDYFAEQYQDDPVFRARINLSLTRVLRLKLSLYDGDISRQNVTTPPTDINSVGESSNEVYPIAQASTTLISPRRESLSLPPGRSDDIVIFTDVRLVQQCSYCAAYPAISANALEVAIERMYGPYAGAQIRPEQVTSFSFSQLEAYLRGGLEGLSSDNSLFRTNQRIGEALVASEWIVLVMQDISPDVSASNVVRSFLESENALVERARIVIMAVGSPVYLSATEVSKLAAYYGLFSGTPPYIDAAARALFQETSFQGALPLSVPAVGYDIQAITEPDPAQTLRVLVESLDGAQVRRSASTTEALRMQIGQRVELQSAPILDHNGNIVPDGTPVEFRLAFVNENLQTRHYTTTRQGVGRTTFTPNTTGQIQVSLSSRDAQRSTTLALVVSDRDQEASAGDASPDGSPGTPPAAVSAVSESGSASASASLPAASDQDADPRLLGVNDFMFSLFALAIMGMLAFTAGISTTSTIHGGIRVVLGAVVGGLTGYIYYGLAGPGARELQRQVQHLAPILSTLAAGLVGMLAAWWMLRRTRP